MQALQENCRKHRPLEASPRVGRGSEGILRLRNRSGAGCLRALWPREDLWSSEAGKRGLWQERRSRRGVRGPGRWLGQ